MDLKDQVIIVTGAGSGLGAATAVRLSAEGASLALLDIQTEPLALMAKQTGGFSVPCDVSSADSGAAAISAVVKRFGKITGCVNCAGIVTGKRIVGRDGPQDLQEY